MEYVLHAICTFAILMLFIEVGESERPDLFPTKNRKDHIVCAIFGGILYPLAWLIVIIGLTMFTHKRILEPTYNWLRGKS